MSNRIHLLSDATASQIAAGEVVHRPSAVVKELIENSMDAGAKKITLVIKDAGKRLIRVLDDGCGMSKEDASICFARHATSKIETIDDLPKLSTMGFRGEALFAIKAVAQVELKTCKAENTVGTCVTIAGSELKEQVAEALPKGTDISVKNLFFNVPARRSFLRSNAVENKHILEVFQWLALARPDVSFTYYQDDRVTHQLPATKLNQRIIHLFGKHYADQLIPCQESTKLMQMKGYVGKPAHAKKTRGVQFFFVNQRFVKSTYLHHAVKRAFADLVPDGTFPFYVLELSMLPEDIDVNVHPNKTEVKFADERMVYAIVNSAVKKALATCYVAPSIDFEQSVKHTPFKPSSSNVTTTTRDKGYRWLSGLTKQQTPETKNWKSFFRNTTASSKEERVPPAQKLEPIVASQANQRQAVAPEVTHAPGQVYFQLHKKYILTQTKSDLLLIDQCAAHERILYEKYFQQLKTASGNAQQLLFPERVVLSPADYTLIDGFSKALQGMGFKFSLETNHTIIVHGYPAESTERQPKNLLESLLEQFKRNQETLGLSEGENLAYALAKRTCLQANRGLAPEEMDMLVSQLFSCANNRYTPGGRRIWTALGADQIMHYFEKGNGNS